MHFIDYLTTSDEFSLTLIMGRQGLLTRISTSFFLASLVPLLLVENTTGTSKRLTRQFSLFSIVSFPDDLCSTNNGKTGWVTIRHLHMCFIFSENSTKYFIEIPILTYYNFKSISRTCLSSEKCGAKSGVNLGICANGFGVCCYCKY